MSQFNQPVRRSSSGVDVYTALLGVAFVVLLVGALALAKRNMDHSAEDGGGSPFKLVQK